MAILYPMVGNQVVLAHGTLHAKVLIHSMLLTSLKTRMGMGMISITMAFWRTMRHLLTT